MAPELARCQARCTTPAADFNGDGTPERTGVSTDDHGWQRGSYSAGFPPPASEPVTSTAFQWRLGYFFMRDVLSDGEYFNVVFADFIAPALTIVARLYNDSGTYKWRLWNVTADTQIGTDSAAQTVGSKLLVNLRTEAGANQIDLFVGGSNVKSASQTLGTPGAVMSGNTDGAATDRAYWSAWSLYDSASDDLNEAHYPEMRLIHPNGEGAHGDYLLLGGGGAPAVATAWDDLVSEGDPDNGATANFAEDVDNQRETSTLTTHAMTNTIQGVAELLVLRGTTTLKTVVHGAIITVAGTDKVVSFGAEDIGEDWVVREAVFHTPPDGGTWDQTNEIDALEAGHRRDAGSEALNVEVTALGIVVVALGTTDLAPADPPGKVSTIVGSAGNSAALGSANAMIV